MIILNDILPFSITSSIGKQQYYDHLEYYKKYGNSISVKRKLPSVEETFEYLDLLKEERHCHNKSGWSARIEKSSWKQIAA